MTYVALDLIRASVGGRAVGADCLDQSEIAGLARHPLAFGAIAEPDDLADPLAERPSLLAELAEPTGAGGGHVMANLPDCVRLGAHRLAIDIAPAGPQAREIRRRRLGRTDLGERHRRRQERNEEQAGFQYLHGYP